MGTLCNHDDYKHATIGVRGNLYMTIGSEAIPPSDTVRNEWRDSQVSQIKANGYTPVVHFWTDEYGDKHETIILEGETE